MHGNEFVYYAWHRDADADDDGVVVVVFGCRPVIPRYAYLKRATQRRRLDKIDVRPTTRRGALWGGRSGPQIAGTGWRGNACWTKGNLVWSETTVDGCTHTYDLTHAHIHPITAGGK